MSQENVETVRRVWEAAERRDTEAALRLYDPAIIWQIHYGATELEGIYHGHEGVRELLRQWREPFENYQEHAETFIDGGEHVIVRVQLSGRGKSSGLEVERPVWNVYRIRNGLVIRVDLFDTKAEALEAAGLSD